MEIFSGARRRTGAVRGRIALRQVSIGTRRFVMGSCNALQAALLLRTLSARSRAGMVERLHTLLGVRASFERNAGETHVLPVTTAWSRQRLRLRGSG